MTGLLYLLTDRKTLPYLIGAFFQLLLIIVLVRIKINTPGTFLFRKWPFRSRYQPISLVEQPLVQ